jgi:hypothetical protein
MTQNNDEIKKLFEEEVYEFIAKIHEIQQDFTTDKPLSPELLEYLLTELREKLTDINDPETTMTEEDDENTPSKP